ncbi:MAG: amino acid adenylation domain-containing protein [Bacteroidetes bacterium]|nr:amino acid adenylation domain-containing protein [Bacteroidota bacterium]
MAVLSRSLLLGPERPELLRVETLADIFRATAQRIPDKAAIIFEGESLSYAALDAWSDGVAAFLNEKGIGLGAHVGIWWPRGLALHAAILGIVKSGAAYVPLDREMPADRVLTVMEEVKADALLADTQIMACCPVYELPDRNQAAGYFSKGRFSEIKLDSQQAWEAHAYVLYTSGSTGKPKGIPISQKNICHLVRSEQAVIGIREEDKVYQGFSISFDMWCEETWISFSAGATLYAADLATAKSVDELAGVLRNWEVTVLHAVPSLLAVMEGELPLVRIINAGGEACTPQVLNRWATEGRVFYNSYGPTETTVTSTMIPLKPGDPITIGDPLPNYNLAVMDEAGNILPAGQRGELVISGPGLSEGYVNRPVLTAQKFLSKPPELEELPGDRYYRTGDAVVITPEGKVDFQGRIDDQIKLRGYRIELGEIEAQLNMLAGVASAAVAVKKDGTDQDTLVGYVVMDEETHFDEAAMRVALAKALPSYMVPALIAPLFSMPRLPSGKIDRKSLPVPDTLLLVDHSDDSDAPIDLRASVQERLLQLLRKVFPGREIDAAQDFFDDLGGHSLLAAVVVSRLRKEAGLPQVSLKDIYLHRPIAKLASYWEEHAAPKPTPEARPFRAVSKKAHAFCTLAQTVCLLFIYGIFAMQIFLPYLGYYYVFDKLTDHAYFDAHHIISYAYAIGTALALFAVMPMAFSAISILGKWLVIGRMKEGDYPLWGSYYFRWWLAKSFERLTPMQYLDNTPLYPAYLRLLGVHVADSAQLSSMSIGAEDLLTIGEDVSIASGVNINNAWVEDGWLKLRRVHIGDHAYIGSSAVLAGGAQVEEWGELGDLSALTAGGKIARAEVWEGSPARHTFTRKEEELPQPLFVSRSKRRRYKLLFSLSLFIFPVFILLPLIPTIITLHQLDNAADPYDFSYLVTTPSLSLAYILIFAGLTILLTRFLQRNIKPGVYPIYSLFYFKKWLADQFLALSLIVLHPIYATVYVSMFFRALGAKVGKNSEISTAASVTHPLLEIGSGSFIADAVTLGEADVRGQQLILKKTSIGDVSFVGNSALIPQGYSLPGRVLVGVLSTPPTPAQLALGDAHDYFGSPALALPRRQDSQAFDDRLTMLPTPGRRLARSLVELVRIILPETVIICMAVIFIAYAHDFVTKTPWWEAILGISMLYIVLIGLPAFLITAALKWIFVGKYEAANYPMWSWPVWRSEAITSTYETLAVPFFLEFLRGTAWLPMLLRLIGVKTGKRVWMNTTDITEYDMVHIGDEAMLNDDSGPQTHLFEDRVMKIGPVKIGARSTVGTRSIILYDSEIGERVLLGPLSLVMKGERLPEETSWTGSPVRSS